jgi:hypothetical protein
VNAGEELLQFDEERLRRRLNALELAGRLAFVASCAERAAPTCLRYTEDERLEAEGRLVRDSLAASWRAVLDPDARPHDRSLPDRLWVFGSFDSDWNKPFNHYVPDCVSAMYFVADFLVTGAVESAVQSWIWIYNAVDALSMSRLGPLSGGSEMERLIEADRSVQRELLKLERDLAAIESATAVNEALVTRLRTDSARLGKAMLDDFLGEAANRLRRGPPPAWRPGMRPSDLDPR